jgi:hypothetical protein
MKSAPSTFRVASAGAVISAVLLGSCSTTGRAPAAPETATMTCNLPIVTALTETQEYQVKGDIGISVAATTFECNRTTKTTEREIQPGLFDSLLLPDTPTGTWAYYMKAETITQPVFELSPGRLTFKVKINNQGTRVFRGTGTVVLYGVSGRNLSVDQANYAGLTNIIVPPRSEAVVDIYGPDLGQLGTEPTTMVLSLYDVATKTDAAGTITEKQNFEWLYNFTTEVRQDSGVVTRSSQVKPRRR